MWLWGVLCGEGLLLWCALQRRRSSRFRVWCKNGMSMSFPCMQRPKAKAAPPPLIYKQTLSPAEPSHVRWLLEDKDSTRDLRVLMATLPTRRVNAEQEECYCWYLHSTTGIILLLPKVWELGCNAGNMLQHHAVSTASSRLYA